LQASSRQTPFLVSFDCSIATENTFHRPAVLGPKEGIFMQSLQPPPQARQSIRQLGASKIREVANAAMSGQDVLAFWFGEPYQATPEIIRLAGQKALARGDTFYHHNLGIPALRLALANYLSDLHGSQLSDQRVAITSSGVNALMLCAQLIIGHGDRVVAVTPLWPNIVEIPKILGAHVVTVPVTLADPNATISDWVLDTNLLLAQLTPDTRAVIINSPNNPTGWVMQREQMQVVLNHCRKHGIWIISDEAYSRLVFDGSYQAPSFLDIASEQDLLLVANTFSKSWQMTGWRLGWIVAPLSLMGDLGKLIEFNTSCAPGFVQQGGLAALNAGPKIITDFVDQLQQSAALMEHRLSQLDGIQMGRPRGAMYAFFKVTGHNDSLALAKELVREHNLGLAPGIAFGNEAEGYLRWCFAKPLSVLNEGLDRFVHSLALNRNPKSF
jgi:aspartate/methionine/tyrosine aminotransferase